MPKWLKVFLFGAPPPTAAEQAVNDYKVTQLQLLDFEKQKEFYDANVPMLRERMARLEGIDVCRNIAHPPAPERHPANRFKEPA